MNENAIIRDAHPAAPRTSETAALYDTAMWINQELQHVTDESTRIYLINQRGELTGQIWRIVRKAKAQQ